MPFGKVSAVAIVSASSSVSAVVSAAAAFHIVSTANTSVPTKAVSPIPMLTPPSRDSKAWKVTSVTIEIAQT